jgi:hypothetical protein
LVLSIKLKGCLFVEVFFPKRILKKLYQSGF